MTNTTAWVLGILVTATAAAAAPPPSTATSRTTLRAGSMKLAELDGDTIVPLRDEAALAGFLEAGLNASKDERVHGTIVRAAIEQSGGKYFLVGHGKRTAGGCLTPSVELEAGPEEAAQSAASQWRFIRVEGCAAVDCPDCLTTRGEDGHVIDCMCLPAGHCEKVVVYIPIPISLP
jgi:hypothetical protein